MAVHHLLSRDFLSVIWIESGQTPNQSSLVWRPAEGEGLLPSGRRTTHASYRRSWTMAGSSAELHILRAVLRYAQPVLNAFVLGVGRKYADRVYKTAAIPRS
jgi:hypothetical protein